MSQEHIDTINTEVLIGDPEKVTNLIHEFMLVGSCHIAALVDYDGTISPLSMNSWDVPGLSNINWPAQAGELRRMAKNGEITVDEFWQQSILKLKERGFKHIESTLGEDKSTPGDKEYTFEDVIGYLENSCLLIRDGIPNLFQTCSQLGRFIIYSAGIKAVIEKHVAKIADVFDTAIPTVVSNELDGINLITINNKDGTTLLHELKKQGVDLNGISHFVLIGDSLADAKMTDGLGAQGILKIGVLSTAKAADPDIEQSYVDNFDIVILSDDSLQRVDLLIQQMIN